MFTRLVPGLLLLVTPPAVAADLRIYPPEILLSGPNRTHQLLVVWEDGGRVVGLPQATFRSSNPQLTQIGPTGRVTVTGTGQATITAIVGDQQVEVKLTAAANASGWSFRHHVLPTLTRTGCNSGACHGALAGKGGLKLSLRGFDPEADWFTLTRQALARRIDLAHPQDSLLLKKPLRTVPHGGGTRISEGDEHHRVLMDWIKAGAPGPRDGEANLVRIEVFPKAALLKPKDTLQVIVQAVYSDGSMEDVTRWARFSSSEELVAGVDEDGVVKVAGHGEAAIVVHHGNKVAVMTVTSPYPNRGDFSAVAHSQPGNLIDRHILKKLELLRLPPSPPCTDGEFLRRAYLDTCGILPSLEETQRFLSDTDLQKREKLIDRLLERPEYVDYWTYRWSELFLVSSRKLPQPAMWAFYRTIRQSVANNEPWDRFARRMLTASGSNLSNGGGNYFVLHKDVSELAETTALTFLGLSLGCAKCHNHPLEKWTQDDYWAFTNLFSRVGLKNGDRAGEVFVQSRSEGEALHLRRGVALPPTPLDGKPLALDSTMDRRVYFVDWLTSPDNPYFARAVVNRIWRNYMGRGLVEPEDDLRISNPASHPELLESLTAEFIKSRYDVKKLMRAILTSAAYQRSSRPLPENAADDRFYSRYLIRRLPAEVILDAYSDITGVPTPFTKIQSAAGDDAQPTQLYPPGTRAIQLPDSLLLSRFLDAFGRAERLATCSCERSTDASVGQALHLNNGQTLNEKLRDPQSLLGKWIADGWTDAEIVDRLFLRALCRQPTPSERAKFVAILAEAAKNGASSRREAIEDFVWAVLTGREFLFNH
jgi:hypothetical protein